MKKPSFLPLLVTAALLSGCATLDVPRADNYRVSSQKKARAVHHWDVLADDVASQLAERMRLRGIDQPLYISPSSATTFNQGFRTLLVTRLVDRGVVVTTRKGGLEMSFETQVVQHSTLKPPAIPFPSTALAAGVAVVRDLALYEHSGAAGIASGVALGILNDVREFKLNGSAAGGPTRTEVLISTSLQQNDLYVARTADIYYIERADATLYQPAQPAASGPVKTWKVVSE
jgi:hypothetical protein